MATAQVSRKWLQEAAEDTLVYIASLRSSDREKIVRKLTKPVKLWTGNYSIMPVKVAQRKAREEVTDQRYGNWEDRVRLLLHLARAAKGDVTLEQWDASELRKE